MSPSTDDLDHLDEIRADLSILQANLTLVVGEGSEFFSSMNAALRDNFMWGFQRLADRALAHVGALKIGTGETTQPAQL